MQSNEFNQSSMLNYKTSWLKSIGSNNETAVCPRSMLFFWLGHVYVASRQWSSAFSNKQLGLLAGCVLDPLALYLSSRLLWPFHLTPSKDHWRSALDRNEQWGSACWNKQLIRLSAPYPPIYHFYPFLDFCPLPKEAWYFWWNFRCSRPSFSTGQTCTRCESIKNLPQDGGVSSPKHVKNLYKRGGCPYEWPQESMGFAGVFSFTPLSGVITAPTCNWWQGHASSSSQGKHLAGSCFGSDLVADLGWVGWN